MIIMGIFALTGCGNDSNETNTFVPQEKVPSKIYAIDGFTGAYDLNELLLFSAMYVNPKIYSFDTDKKLYINYQNLPIFKTEVLKQIITPTKMFSAKSQYLGSYNYLIADQANFDGQKLKYTINDESSSEMLTLSWEYKKIDVSGKPITSDLNNPIHKIQQSGTSQTLAAVYGVGFSETDIFPQGSVCWQKQYAQSSQEYIDFYPERIVQDVNEEQRVLRTGQWQNTLWTEYEPLYGHQGIANVKLIINDQTFLGFYHAAYEKFDIQPDQLSCDFMNESAFNAVTPKLDKFNQQYKLDSQGGS